MKKLIEKLEKDFSELCNKLHGLTPQVQAVKEDIAALKAAIKRDGGTITSFDSPPDPEPDGPGTGGGH